MNDFASSSYDYHMLVIYSDIYPVGMSGDVPGLSGTMNCVAVKLFSTVGLTVSVTVSCPHHPKID